MLLERRKESRRKDFLCYTSHPPHQLYNICTVLYQGRAADPGASFSRQCCRLRGLRVDYPAAGHAGQEHHATPPASALGIRPLLDRSLKDPTSSSRRSWGLSFFRDLSFPRPLINDLSSPRPLSRDLSSPRPLSMDLSSPRPLSRDLSSPRPLSRDLTFPRTLSGDLSSLRQLL